MITIPMSDERPKSIIKTSFWYPEEMDKYIEETLQITPAGKQSKADRTKELLYRGASAEMAGQFGFFKLRPMRHFFKEKSCRTLVLYVGHLSDPQTRFIESRGLCGREN